MEVPDIYMVFVVGIVTSVITTLIVSHLKERRLRSIEGRLNNRLSRESKMLRRNRINDVIKEGIKGVKDRRPIMDVISDAVEKDPLIITDVVKEAGDLTTGEED